MYTYYNSVVLVEHPHNNILLDVLNLNMKFTLHQIQLYLLATSHSDIYLDGPENRFMHKAVCFQFHLVFIYMYNCYTS